MATDAVQAYTADAITHLDPLEHVRKRPGMYIGRTGNGSHPDDGIYILLKEVIDNSIDEFIMGCGRRVDVTIEDNAVSIRDYGRGIPLEKLVECVSVMNTGGKYSDDVFQFSIGLNGVGTKAVNALSIEFTVKSIRDGKFREAKFSRGKLLDTVEGECTEKNGTFVRFVPDNEIFPDYKFRNEYISKRLWMYAYLNSGISLYYNGERYYSANGLQDLLDSETGEDKLYDIIYYKSKDIEFSLTHSDRYGENALSFVNGQYTSDGGTHLSAFKEGVLKGINEYSGKSFKADAIRDGMVGVIAVKVKEPNFESQTKNKLVNTDVRGPIVAQVSAAVADFLHKNKEIAECVLDKVQRNEQMHRKIQEVKKMSRETTQKMVLRIPKLKDCKYHVGAKWPRGTEPRETMIFLTEGDSAAGSLVKKRDVECQAIFALRGKPKNAYGENIEMIYKNEELNFLIQALGIEESTENLRYDKVIIATDADVDGLHIRNLLLTFFLCFYEQLVLSGHLYILETPLFRVSKPKESPIYCYNESERDAAAAKLGSKAEITRFKGLGEISPDDFGEFIGENIRLSPVSLDNMRGIPEILKFYMGENTPERKEYIMQNLEVVDYE
ncbi:MAG: type IIA DNA topoisomerase subunit B [Lentisphaerae bacterium]|nr:type IIA DNA topoisomerase subunit B [Lentisphaerota bacterium]